MCETNSDRKGEGERANNNSGTFIPHPVFIVLSQYQVMVVAVAVEEAATAAASEAESVFSGPGGKDADNAATGGGGNGVSHHDANDDAGDYQSHC